jgi:hypothetical protein
LQQQYGYYNSHSATDLQKENRFQEMLLDSLEYLREREIAEKEARVIFELECG